MIDQLTADIAVKRQSILMDATLKHKSVEPYSLIPVRANTFQGKLELEDISFRYSDNHPWLYQGLNITIKPHKCTVVMGLNGFVKPVKGFPAHQSGLSRKMRRESKLAKLLLGFVQPQEVQIKIKSKAKLDGKDIRYLSAKELRNVFGVTPINSKSSQETLLFSGTIYENEPYAASFSVS